MFVFLPIVEAGWFIAFVTSGNEAGLSVPDRRPERGRRRTGGAAGRSRPGGTTGTLTIEHSEFANNGLGDGCNAGGCTHNVYVANVDRLNFRFNWSHRIATDTMDKGHLLKSRAKLNYILYNRLSGEDGFDSYEIDLPNGGNAVITGNVIEKGPHAENRIAIWCWKRPIWAVEA